MEINYYFDASKVLHPFTFSAEANHESAAPSNALRTEPNFKTGYWPCEKNGKWVQVDDHREKTLYCTQTGLLVELKEVGLIPENMTTKARPDPYHTWNGAGWEVTTESEAQKEVDIQAAQMTSAKQSTNDANQHIEILQDRIELEDYNSQSELVGIEVQLKAWKKYRIELNKFISGTRGELPEAP